MNTIYRLVWNRALGIVQVATEYAKAPRGGQVSSNVGGSPRRSRLAQACAAALLIGVGAAVIPAASANAGATYQVTSPTDSGDTTASGTLSWAIYNVNTNPGSTIDFNLTSGTTITETGTLPSLDQDTIFTSLSDVTITGAMTGSGHLTWSGAGTLTLDGNGTVLTGGADVIGGKLVVGSTTYNEITGSSSSGDGGTGVGMSAGYGSTTSALDVGEGSTVRGGDGLTGFHSGVGGAGGVGVDVQQQHGHDPQLRRHDLRRRRRAG